MIYYEWNWLFVTPLYNKRNSKEIKKELYFFVLQKKNFVLINYIHVMVFCSFKKKKNVLLITKNSYKLPCLVATIMFIRLNLLQFFLTISRLWPTTISNSWEHQILVIILKIHA